MFELTSLFLYVALATCAFYLAIMFFLKIRIAWGSGIDLAPFVGLGVFVLFFGMGYVLWGYFHYFEYEFAFHDLGLYKAAILMTYFALVGFVFFSEKVVGKTKYIFTIFSIGCLIYGIFFTYTVEELRFFTYVTNPINVTVIFVSFLYFVLVRTRGKIRRKMAYAFGCFLGYVFFFLLDTELGKSLSPLPIEVTSIIASIGTVICLITIGHIFLSFETFTEFGWKEKLKELYIIGPNGTTLFHYSFRAGIKAQDYDLVSGGLTGIEGILGEMVESQQKLRVVDHQDVKIIFEYGRFTTTALIAYENLRIYYSKLTALSTQFETLFGGVLAHWTGEVEVFHPTKGLVENIFS
jgi:hypothetical protein